MKARSWLSRSAVIGVLAGVVALGPGRAAADQMEVPVDPTAPARVGFDVRVIKPADDDGRHLRLTIQRTIPAGSPAEGTSLLVLRRPAAAGDGTSARATQVGDGVGPTLSGEFLGGGAAVIDASTMELGQGTKLGAWVVVAMVEGDAKKAATVDDEVPPQKAAVYALVPARVADGKVVGFPGEAVVLAPATPEAAWFNRGRAFYLLFVVLTGVALFVYMRLARTRAKDMFIRRIPGVDAIEDAVGRSTEMGRPVLYVTGIEEITDIQTIASLLILGRVAELTAEYDTEIKVANTYPMTMVVAEEIVRNSYANVGRLDAHRPENVMFITTEQFAFAAAVNGMILRDRPATNIYLGRFFAESLMLAETGFLTGAVQIAGTAEFTQLPFFIAACDYTLIGEELYATSAYLSRDPNQIAQLKAADVMKVVSAILIVVGVIAMTVYHRDLLGELFP
ncbi:MAG: hypothetical protein KBG28_24380 [Kofleriaceae bacterium]|nr:hypothetical protein [Kofleriaceae bacterium]